MSAPRESSTEEHDANRGFVAPPSGERLFRRRAMERYARREEESVLPRLARPPVFAALWTLLALLVVLAGVVGAMPLADERRVTLVVGQDGPFLLLPVRHEPPLEEDSDQASVNPGDPLRVVLGGEVIEGRVGAIMGEVLSPADIEARLGAAAAANLDGPCRLASVELDPGLDAKLDLATFEGAVADARVTVARPRAATLVPGVGPLLARLFGIVGETAP